MIVPVLFEDRIRAESFGAVAELYDRARPSYPPALVDALLEAGVRRVLDVGTGTGIAAALLAARGATVLGVEIDARMAELARAKGLEVEVASFERWEPAGRSFELLTAAQAWHWIDPRSGIDRAATALDPGGRIAVFWNLGDPPPHVQEHLAPIYATLEPGLGHDPVVPGADHARAGAALSAIADSPRFEAAQMTTFPWTMAYDTASWLECLASHSDHQTLAPARRQRLLTALGDALDALGGSFVMSYETVLVSARRR